MRCDSAIVSWDFPRSLFHLRVHNRSLKTPSVFCSCWTANQQDPSLWWEHDLRRRLLHNLPNEATPVQLAIAGWARDHRVEMGPWDSVGKWWEMDGNDMILGMSDRLSYENTGLRTLGQPWGCELWAHGSGSLAPLTFSKSCTHTHCRIETLLCRSSPFIWTSLDFVGMLCEYHNHNKTKTYDFDLYCIFDCSCILLSDSLHQPLELSSPKFIQTDTMQHNKNRSQKSQLPFLFSCYCFVEV